MPLDPLRSAPSGRIFDPPKEVRNRERINERKEAKDGYGLLGICVENQLLRRAVALASFVTVAPSLAGEGVKSALFSAVERISEVWRGTDRFEGRRPG